MRHESFVVDPDLEPLELESGALSVVVATAEPSDLGEPAEVDFEGETIRHLLANAGSRFALAKHSNLTCEQLKARCEEADFHVFHFAGHGGFFPEAAVDEDGRLDPTLIKTAEKKMKGDRGGFVDRGHHAGGARRRGAIVLERSPEELAAIQEEAVHEPAANPRPHHIVWSDELAKLLMKAKVKVVVLSACESARRESGKFRWSGVAPALLKAGIPVVIGMQYLINDDTAIAFSEGLYKALASGLSLDQAVMYGRHAIMDRDEDDRDQTWGVPVIYTRTADRHLFPELVGGGESDDGAATGVSVELRSECLSRLYEELGWRPGG